MKKRRIFAVFIFVSIVVIIGGGFVLQNQQRSLPQEVVQSVSPDPSRAEVLTGTTTSLPEEYSIITGTFVGQTFNNCGPASLSMTMSLLGKDVSQADLAASMRPFNNPQGGIDDKSIFAHEFVFEAKRQGFNAVARPNGDINLVKEFIANDIPVVVRTWLNDHEDIGHFRVVTGYDGSNQTLLYQDSYYGPNQMQSEVDFENLWQPFNYGFIIVYPDAKAETVEKIIGENMDEKTAWENAKKRAEGELQVSQNDSFALFNLATAEYYLGNYERTLVHYEQAVLGLPSRMLWYQPEPIYAYQKTKQYDRAIALSDQILQNGNVAYSELYQIKGEIYKEQGNTEIARDMFEKAVYYNASYQPAKEALKNL